MPIARFEKIEDIVSDKEVSLAFKFTNFGSMSSRGVIRFGLLKCVAGYYQGKTSEGILKTLDLIDFKYDITDKGREYLFHAFEAGNNL